MDQPREPKGSPKGGQFSGKHAFAVSTLSPYAARDVRTAAYDSYSRQYAHEAGTSPITSVEQMSPELRAKRDAYFKAHLDHQYARVDHDNEYYEKRRSEFADGWKSSSTSYKATIMKEAIREEFNASGKTYDPKGHLTTGDIDQRATRVNTYRAVARRMYRETQNHLNELFDNADESNMYGRRGTELQEAKFDGINGTFTLYRGTTKKYTVHNTIESWSSYKSVAYDFAGREGKIFKKSVRPDKILTWYGSPTWKSKGHGPGMDEHEFIVIGD